MRRWQVITFAAFLASVVPLKGELQQIYAPHFAADAVHSSRLVVHNKRVDAEVTLKVYALLEKGERVSRESGHAGAREPRNRNHSDAAPSTMRRAAASHGSRTRSAGRLSFRAGRCSEAMSGKM